MKPFKNGKFYRKGYFINTIENFRNGGITLKTILYRQNIKKWQIPDIGGIMLEPSLIDEILR